MPADFHMAKRQAAQALKNHGINRPPIDPEALAEAMGVDVVYANFPKAISDQVSGFLEVGDNPRIVVNKAIHANRKTFTIAHELGHYLMHREYAESGDYQVLPRRNQYNREKPDEEREADAFAANLLVPMQMLHRYKDIASTQELATTFLVSEDVILNRLKWA